MDRRVFDSMAAALPGEALAAAPDLAVVLGSGWGEALEIDEPIARVPYALIPHLGASTVKGHKGELVLYRRAGKLVAAWCGRRHLYEGVVPEAIIAPVELSRRMGAKKLLLTNAAGGISEKVKPGDFLILSDHINLAGFNPLVGEHNPEWGERFPDMSAVYSSCLGARLAESCADNSVRATSGVYAFTSGPSYETPAEIRAFRALGADAVGMSTVPEAVFAKACGFEVAALSLITNYAAGIASAPLDHEEVVMMGKAAKPKMRTVIEGFLARL